MRLRWAGWGGDAYPVGWRGWSIALITKRRIINLELHYERRRCD